MRYRTMTSISTQHATIFRKTITRQWIIYSFVAKETYVAMFVQSSCEHCTTGCELKQLMDKKRAECRQSERKGKKRK